jgi:hypothetical protein
MCIKWQRFQQEPVTERTECTKKRTPTAVRNIKVEYIRKKLNLNASSRRSYEYTLYALHSFSYLINIRYVFNDQNHPQKNKKCWSGNPGTVKSVNIGVQCSCVGKPAISKAWKMKHHHTKFIGYNLLTPISCMYKKVSYSARGYLRIDAETFHCAASNCFTRQYWQSSN